MISAIVSDLDDTLLREDNTISEYTVQVMRRAKSQGCRIILATGRTHESYLPYAEQLGCVDAAIAANGAEVWSAKGELLKIEQFRVQDARKIADYGVQKNFYTQTYENGKFYYSSQEKGRYALQYASVSSLKGEYAGDLRKFITRPVSKLLMIDEPEIMAKALPEARQKFAGIASVTCSKPYFLEFNPVNATKGIALTFLCGLLGIDLADVMAFGDSLNDLSMLEAAGHGVCVMNARQEVKNAVPVHCGSNNDDGVAKYVDKFLWDEEEPR